MCPNCILNQAGMSGGLYVAFGICVVFFIVGVVALIWGLRDGQFDNMEDSKFDMLDDSPDGIVAERARRAAERARAQSMNSN
jgi:cbb3-type cytochrome oxidase maturation protein